MNVEEFQQQLFAEFQISLTEEQLEQFAKYYELLVEWNQKMNLTAITDLEEVYLKHFYDSLTLLHYQNWAEVTTVADIGAGAGFPSLPLKIIYPHLEITIVDSLNKRITFLTELTKALGLTNVTLVHDRAETFGQSPNRNSFDVVTARAVARLNVLSELCVPLVRKNGYFLALKGEQGLAEVKEAKKAFDTLGITQVDTSAFTLANGDQRVLVMAKKGKETSNKYPRKPGTPNRKPL